MLSRSDSLCLVCFAACAVAFGVNSYLNIDQYMAGKTTFATSTLKEDEGIRLPAITFCNKSAYKKDEVFTTINEYLNHTVNIEDLFAKKALLWDSVEEGEQGSFKSIYTKYKGHCFTYAYSKKVLHNRT